MARVDIAATRAELERLETQLRDSEGSVDDDELLDLVAEINELRDVLRNHEEYPALWQRVGSSCASGGASPQESRSSSLQLELQSFGSENEACWRLRGLLGELECAELLAAALEDPGFVLDAGGSERSSPGGETFNAGPVRRSDDPEFATEMWARLRDLVPRELAGSVAPAAEAALRTEVWTEFDWKTSCRSVGVDVRVVYELLTDAGQGDESQSRSNWRCDTEDADDRDEGARPMLSVIASLGRARTLTTVRDSAMASRDMPVAEAEGGVASGDGDVEIEFVTSTDGIESSKVSLGSGDAVVFRRGTPRLRYRLLHNQLSMDSPINAVVHCKVLYVLPGCE